MYFPNLLWWLPIIHHDDSIGCYVLIIYYNIIMSLIKGCDCMLHSCSLLHKIHNSKECRIDDISWKSTYLYMQFKMYVIGIIKSVDYDEMLPFFNTVYSFAGTAFTKHTIFLGAISCLFSLESSTGL